MQRMAPAASSRTIRLLEHDLGCQLLIRSNRGISLTPEGERLYSHVKVAMEQLQSAEEELKMLTGLHEGVVSVGASETALHLLLLPVLKKFRESHPQIRIRIQNHLTLQAIESVRQSLVDFAVVTSPASVSDPLKSSSLMHFQDILIGGNAFQSLSQAPVSLHDIQHLSLIHISICCGNRLPTWEMTIGWAPMRLRRPSSPCSWANSWTMCCSSF